MVPIDCKACMGKFCVEHRGTVEHGCEERKENLRNSYQERWFRKGKTGGERVNGNGSPKVGSSTSNLGTDIKSKFGKLNLGGVSSLTSSNGSSSNSNSTPMNKTSTPTPQKDNKPTSKPFNFMDKSDKWVPKPLFGVSRA